MLKLTFPGYQIIALLISIKHLIMEGVIARKIYFLLCAYDGRDGCGTSFQYDGIRLFSTFTTCHNYNISKECFTKTRSQTLKLTASTTVKKYL